MDFLELSKARYSLRKYSPKSVEKEKLLQILEAGRIAPTAANLQPQRIFVLQDPAQMDKARAVTRMMYNAPMALMVCYDSTESWKNTAETFGEDYEGGEVDAAIVTTAMMMEAAELGVGSLWVRGFNAPKMHEAFELPESLHIVAILLLGYPADETVKPSKNHTNRKELGKTVVWM